MPKINKVRWIFGWVNYIKLTFPESFIQGAELKFNPLIFIFY